MTRMRIFAFVVVVVLLAFSPNAAVASPDIVGKVPSPGTFGFLATGRNITPVDLVSAFELEGCIVRTIAITRNGKWVIYVSGAPRVVNLEFPEELVQNTPFYVRCGIRPFVYTSQKTDGLDPGFATGIEIAINQIRQEHGLSELRHDDRLQETAELYVTLLYEVVNDGSYQGDPQDGRSVHFQDENPSVRAKRQGYVGFVAEVTKQADGGITLVTPDSLARGWLDSPPHRAVILGSSYQDFGAGCYQTGYTELKWWTWIGIMCVVNIG